MIKQLSNQNCWLGHASDIGVGVVLFDDIIQPQKAWARVATPNAKTCQISGPEELDSSIIWWSNLSTEFFLQNPDWSHYSWIKPDRYPMIRPDEALMEWGFAPTRPEFSDTPIHICEFLCNIFWRIMAFSIHLVQNLKSDISMHEFFKGEYLFNDLDLLIPNPAKSKQNRNFQPNVVNIPSFKIFQNESSVLHDQILVLRKPRLSYVRTMLNTPTLRLKHSIEYDSEQPELQPFLAELEQTKRAGLTTITKVCIANYSNEALTSIENWFEMIQEQDRKCIWVTSDELLILTELTEFTILSSHICEPSSAYIAEFSAPIFELFNGKIFESSWTVGIIAELLWRTLCQQHTLLTGSEEISGRLNEIYLQNINKSMMLEATEFLVNSGFNTLGYGFGQITMNLAKQQFIDGILCGMKVGLTPSMFDVPKHAFKVIQEESWHGCSSSFALVGCQLTHDRERAWNFDTLPLINPDVRSQCLER